MHTRLRLRPLRLRRPIPYVFFLNVSFLNIDSSSHSRRGRSSISSSRSSSSSGPPSAWPAAPLRRQFPARLPQQPQRTQQLPQRPLPPQPPQPPQRPAKLASLAADRLVCVVGSRLAPLLAFSSGTTALTRQPGRSRR